MKGKRFLACMMSAVMAIGTVNFPTYVAKATRGGYEDAYTEQGYHFVWGDEFEGDSLNTQDWNVEKREAGYANNELQAYPDAEHSADNIKVQGGKLIIQPKAVEKSASSGGTGIGSGNGQETEENLIKNPTFSGTTSTATNWSFTVNTEKGGDGSISYEAGKANIVVTNSGTENYAIQLHQSNLALTRWHKYHFSMKASSTVGRKIELSVLDPNANYNYYGGKVESLTATEKEVEFDIDCSSAEKVTSGTIELQINLGLIGGEADDSKAATVTISEPALVDVTPNLLQNSTFSGTANTAENWSFSNAEGGNGSISYEAGKANITVVSSGTKNYGIQLQQSNMILTNGHKYYFSMKASSTVGRKIQLSMLDPNNNYKWYAGTIESLTATEKEVAFDIDCSDADKVTSQTMALQINLGLIENNADDSKAATVTISDLSLVDITEPSSSGSGSQGQNGGTATQKEAYENYNFTSGRINTENKHNFTYGLFEAKVKVPKGAGYLPAFWLLAANEDEKDDYAKWPVCGEIDMMEVIGSETNKAYGTIHYGNPHMQKQGTKTTAEGADDFSEDFHIFKTEWKPGEIIWYVDGVEFYRTSDWFSTKDDGRTLTYPAPFDHDMYLILNLAIGGDWNGNPDQAAIDDMANQKFEVDYVRVYQKDTPDSEDVKEPDHTVTLRSPGSDGNYIDNTKYDENLQVKSEDSRWEFKTAMGGAATATHNGSEFTIQTTNKGTADYSVQLVHWNLPIEQGKKYQLSFKAKAAAERTMKVAVQAPDRNWIQYLKEKVVDLTTEEQTFTYDFEMTNLSDGNGRLDFNMGNMSSTADVTIKDVVLKQIGDVPLENDTTKYPRSDGNRIYNGSFDEGVNRLGEWTIQKDFGSTVYVTNELQNGQKIKRLRQLVIEASDSVSETSPLVISQSDIEIGAGEKYNLSWSTKGDSGTSIKMSIGGQEAVVNLDGSEQMAASEKLLTMPQTLSEDDHVFKMVITKPGTYYVDDIALKKVDHKLIKNGDFSDAQSNWGTFTDSGADVSYAFKKGEAAVTISKTGTQDWHSQLYQDGIELVKGQKYVLTFKAKSTRDRKIKYSIQHNGAQDNNWDPYTSGDGVIIEQTDDTNEIQLTNEYKEFKLVFEMKSATDQAARFDLALGEIDEEINEEHTVYFDDILLQKLSTVTAPEAKTGLIYTGSEQELITAGTSEGGTMYYAVTTADTEPVASLYTESLPKATGGGTYYVWYKVVGEGVYSDVAPSRVIVTIEKKTSDYVDSDVPYTPSTPEGSTSSGQTETYTAQVSGDSKESISADITNGNAVINEITQSVLNQMTETSTTAESGKGEGTDGNNSNNALTIDVSGAKSNVTSVEISDTSFKKIAETVEKNENVDSVEIKMTDAEVKLDGKAINAVSEQAGGNSVKVVVEKTETTKLNTVQQDSLKQFTSVTTFQAAFQSGGNEIHDFRGGKVTVSMRFTPEVGKDAKHYHVYYLPLSGLIERFITRIVGNMLMFETSHFSDYAIVYDESIENETGKTETAVTPAPTVAPTATVMPVVSPVPSASASPITSEVPQTSMAPSASAIPSSDKVSPVTTEEKEKAAITMNAGLKVIHNGKTATVKWGTVSGADFYRVYAAYSDKTKFEMVKKVKKDATRKVTIKKLGGKQLSTKKNIKVYVAAYRKAETVSKGKTVLKNVCIATSITGYVTGRKNTKYSNAKEITLAKASYTLKKGGSVTIQAKTVLQYPKKQQIGDAYAMEFRYASSDKKIASVDKNGKVKAKKKGNCIVYVYARNGLAKQIKITVK